MRHGSELLYIWFVHERICAMHRAFFEVGCFATLPSFHPWFVCVWGVDSGTVIL